MHTFPHISLKKAMKMKRALRIRKKNRYIRKK